MLEGGSKFFKAEAGKQESQENLELRREGERIYTEEFAGKLDDILGHEFKVKGEDGRERNIVLKDIIDRHLEGFSSPEFAALSMEGKAEKQREFVRDLGRGVDSIPFGDIWAFYFKRMMETGETNCSGSSSLLGMILEGTKEQSGIKSVEQGYPFGHAVNMITLGDSRLYLADTRSGLLEDISNYAQAEDRKGLKVYKIKQPRDKNGGPIPWHNIPAVPMKEGVIGMYLGNLRSAYEAGGGNFDEALSMGYSSKELEEIQKMAKDVCRERGLSSPEEYDRLGKVQEFFVGKINEYLRSPEFRREIRRVKKLTRSKLWI